MVERFTRSWMAEAADDGGELLPSVLARAAAAVLNADGAGLSLMSGPGLRLPLGASDDDAATAERLQFTIGEGPCFEAFAAGRPVTVTAGKLQERWPSLAPEHLGRTPYRAGLSVPLRQGAERFGVLDLYLRGATAPEGHDVIAAQLIAEVVAGVLLETIGPDAGEGDAPSPGSPSAWLDSPAIRRRRDVWVAVGMANLKLHLSSDDALATLRGHAYASGQTLDELAREVVQDRFDLQELRADAEP
nr:GAF and ANTAR domain-containing protein [Kineococcus siccus]